MLYDLFSDFFGDDLNLFMHAPHTAQTTVPNAVCPKCHMSLAEFSKTGRLGCPHCYEAFKPYLTQVLTSIHGNAAHTGKIAKNASEKLKAKRELEQLGKQLDEAVAKQDFERAATLHDQINALKQKGDA